MKKMDDESEEEKVLNGSLWFVNEITLKRVFVIIDALNDERFLVSRNEFFDGHYMRKNHGKLSSAIDYCNYRRLA